MACDDDRTRAVGTHKTGRASPKVLANPQKVIAVLVAQQHVDRHVGPSAVRREVQRLETRVHEDVGPVPDRHMRTERQRLHPVDQVHTFADREALKPRMGRISTVHLPLERRQFVARVVDEVEHHRLMVAHEHVGAWKRLARPDDRDGVGAAIDHVADDPDLIVLSGRYALEKTLERAMVPMYVRKDVCRHNLTSRMRLYPKDTFRTSRRGIP